MKRSSWVSWRQAHARAASLSLGELFRRPLASLLAWMMIAIALSLPAVLLLLLDNVKQLDQLWQGRAPTASIYLKAMPQAQVLSLQADIGAIDAIASTRRIDPQQALAHLQEVTGLRDLEQVLPKNPLPTVLVVTPKRSALTSESLVPLKLQLKQFAGVDFVQWDLAWVNRMLAFIDLGERFVIGLSILLGLGVLLIVGNTIRLSLLRHRREIDVLSLVGATCAFIRRPFLYRGFWLGLGGGLLACVCLVLLQMSLSGPVDYLAMLYHSSFQLRGLSVGSLSAWVLGASLLGVLGSYLACGRLRPRPDLSGD